MTRTRLATLLGALFSCVLVLAGCANLPDSSAPQALGTLNRQPTSTGPHPPTTGRDPDLLLHDFLEATADPTDHHRTARQYLTAAAAQDWDDSTRTVIVDKPDTLRESRSGDTTTYRIRGRKLGELRDGGSFRAQDNTYETRIEMTKVGDDWRISQVEPGVVVDSSAFYKSYRRYPLYFANLAGTTMVPDLRWVSTTKDQLAQRLLSLLSEGAQPALAPAVRNVLAQPIHVRDGITKANGATDNVGVGLGGVRIDFSGAAGLDAHSRELLAAQVVLTLAGADIPGPYVLLADGKPLDERYPGGWSLDDVSSLNPAVSPNDRSRLYALRDGALVTVNPAKAEIVPAPGYFGSVHNLQSVGLSEDGRLVAAVADSGQPPPAPRHTLVLGNFDGTTMFSVVQGDSFTRPSWTSDGGAVWTVVDGSRVVRVVHDRATGNVSVQDVDSSALTVGEANSTDPVPRLPITDLSMSRDGTRAAIIAGGKVYSAVVVQQPDGKYSLISPQPVAVDLSTTAVSIDWSTPDTLVLAREGDVNPVESVFIDGSELSPLSSQNLTPPVRAVSAAPGTLYAADSRAVMQLQAAGPAADRFWRETPGLGANTVPVLPG
ncbi:MtrAB system accessory lipoprotein LpqB [Nocardia veterana]|uniref:Lipoprotein LpqB n=1 Tax=Nocardia veterana TaxID=132249 RepID=A0A7X6LY57_9NOCA|nr:MtrAB system accessory lipoprotein LpqB [Nocardia veterana]NKY86035.1 MtrAB system accessory protein LpqB [Nocardia veterana]